MTGKQTLCSHWYKTAARKLRAKHVDPESESFTVHKV